MTDTFTANVDLDIFFPMGWDVRHIRDLTDPVVSLCDRRFRYFGGRYSHHYPEGSVVDNAANDLCSDCLRLASERHILTEEPMYRASLEKLLALPGTRWVVLKNDGVPIDLALKAPPDYDDSWCLVSVGAFPKGMPLHLAEALAAILNSTATPGSSVWAIELKERSDV